jgi:hypothetical protein
MAIKRNLTDKARALILAAASKGSTDKEILKALGITYTIWSRWLREKPEFRDEVQDARLPALEDVEAALYRRAIGYDYVETVVENKFVNGKEYESVKTYAKQLAPDVTAQTFILQNRRGDRWAPANKLDIDKGKVAYIVTMPE